MTLFQPGSYPFGLRQVRDLNVRDLPGHQRNDLLVEIGGHVQEAVGLDPTG